MVIPKELESILESDPDRVHGAVCFKGTRVPVEVLIDYSEEGSSLASFLEDFPGVPKESAEAVLSYLSERNRHVFDLAS